MKVELLAGFPVVVEQAVAWGDMDSYQHVNNVVYFRYFENARLEYFRRLDWFEFEKETGVSPILASTRKRKIARARLAASGALILIWVMRRPGDAKASGGR